MREAVEQDFGPLEEFHSSLRRMKNYATTIRESIYELGLELSIFLNKRLYLHKYRSWDEFCRSEMEFSGLYSRRIIRVTESFSKEEVMQFGIEKLAYVLKAPLGERTEILEKAKNLTTRETFELTKGGSSRPEPLEPKMAGLVKGSHASVESRGKIKIVQSGPESLPVENEGSIVKGGTIIKMRNRIYFVPPKTKQKYDITEQLTEYVEENYETIRSQTYQRYR